MKGTKTLLLTLAAFGAVSGAAATSCADQCQADESIKMAKCGFDYQCIESVQAGVNLCLERCAKMTPGAVPLVGALVGVDPARVPVGMNECHQECANVYGMCADYCKNTQCLNVDPTEPCLPNCLSGCSASQQQCNNGCGPETRTDAIKMPMAKAKKPVEGVACVAACKLTAKIAEAACKFQKPSHRARCKENVAKVETDCEAACVLIPTEKVDVETNVEEPSATQLPEEEYRAQFTAFVKKYSKKYTTDEFFPRYSIFKANLNKIRAHASIRSTYRMAINEFADMTFAEFHKKMTGYKHRDESVLRKHNAEGPHSKLDVLASSVDWREKNAVTPVKNQQQCGSCWAFSTTGSTEGAHAIKTGDLVSLSEQQLVDCSAAQGNQGCNGGMMDQGFQYIISNGGITTEDAYPYTATQGTCQTNVTVAATLSSFVDVTSGSETALMQAVNIGPVSVAIEADQQCFQFYSGGVLSDPSCGTNLDHGVLVVGYGTDNTVSPPADYWIVKNSWGDSWGEQGYIRLARGSNECGIATEPSYPVV